MRTRLASVLFLLVNGNSLIAQTERPLPASGMRSAAVGVSASAPICDGSEMQRAHYRGHVGDGLMIGSLILTSYAVGANHDTPERAMSYLGAGLGVALVGAYLHWTARPDDGFWNRIIARATPGESSSFDVEQCLREPDARSSSLRDETLTYYLRRPALEGLGFSEFRSVSFTFKDSLLVEIRRTDARVPNYGRPVVQAPPPGDH